YEDAFHHAHPIIDELREKMEVEEDPRYSRDYLDPSKRSIANALQVFFTDGSSTDRIEIEYPLGHRRRREEGIPALQAKFLANLRSHYDEERSQKIYDLCNDRERLEAMPVHEFMEVWVG